MDVTQYGLVGIFALLAVEMMGVPLPTQAVYVAAAAILAQGTVTYLQMILLMQTGLMAGAVVSYAIGRGMARGMKRRPQLSPVQEKISGWYRQYGLLALVGAPLIGYVRPWASYVAGLADVSFFRFFIPTFFGVLVFNVLQLSLIGIIESWWTRYPAIRIFMVLSFFVGFILLYAVNRQKKHSA